MWITIAILVVSAALFVHGKIRSDIVALCALCCLLIFQIWVLLPLWISFPLAITLLPTLTVEMWLPLTCIPNANSSGAHRAKEPKPANDSANAKDAPPFKVP